MLDRLAIDKYEIPGFELMLRAGKSAYLALRQHWPTAQSLSIFCGPGNNGGDGLVMAGLAIEQSGDCSQVSVYLVGGEDAVRRLRGEARQAYDWAIAKGVVVQAFDPKVQIASDVVVDALLGTGLKGEVRGGYVKAIELINKASVPTLSVDIPSGLCSDTGAVLGSAIVADLTVTFIGLKRGMLTHRGVDHCGKLLFSSLELPEAVYREFAPSVKLIDPQSVRNHVPPRARSAHKGNFGHLLVVGGDKGMAGAALMAAQAAIRSGAGLVSLATRPENVASCNIRCPEVMAQGVRSGLELKELMGRATTVLIGPGLGTSAWSGQLLNSIQSVDMPMVWDADALNLLSQITSDETSKAETIAGEQDSNRKKPEEFHEDDFLQDRSHNHNGLRNNPQWKKRVLTPHPGEAARLLGVDTGVVQADRFSAARSIQRRFGGVTVLKGAGTLINDGKESLLCHQGNPGMASGGMGDVLAGVIAALMAQGLTPMIAASVGVSVHAQAADAEAAENGERGMLATDLITRLRKLLNPPLTGENRQGGLSESPDE
ncbi:hypothetical protein BGP75_17015 [Motiliproteus sp. MSK22-1]|nr:hypothetical protein BGP75_17015 [Motiliproteus sp. MSK22-1]